ncbi:MAG TPA: pilus assembly protein N-terminal domain-containing protein [Pirellula sp.]|nr:pilus assembly protein N-terminal domain-containing protein [Pirellula sp.]
MNFSKNEEGKENSPIVAGPDLVDIRVVQQHLMSQPTELPAFVLDKSAMKPQETPEQAGVLSQNAVRISVVDGVSEQVPLTRAESCSGKEPKSRTPELVKSKPTQLSHTVTLAQSTNLELLSLTEPSDENIPPVELESAGQQFFSIGRAGPSSKPPKNLNSSIKVSLSDNFESQSIRENGEPLFIDNQLNKSASVLTTDNLSRKFDARASQQSSITAVELEYLGATTIDLSGKLVAVAVQDESVCKAIHNERTVSLVGNQVGTTMVQIWTADLGNKPRVILVNVSQPWGKVQATRSDVNSITQVIAQGFPRSEINIVSKDDGTFEVRGTTDSEESARRILELVRKLYLVPVKDKLTVSN